MSSRHGGSPLNLSPRTIDAGLPLIDSWIGFAIGDVSGQGLGASLIMAPVRAMEHVLARTISRPSRIVDL